MNWNAAQQKLLDIADEPVAGFDLHIVEMHRDGACLREVLRHIHGQARRDNGARQIVISAASAWDVLMALQRIGGCKLAYGSGWYDATWRAVSSLIGVSAHREPIVLWVQDARMMRLSQRETVVCMLENAAMHLGLDLRVVLLVGQSSLWRGKALGGEVLGRREYDPGEWIGAKVLLVTRSPYLEQFAKVWEFGRAGKLKQIDRLPDYAAAQEPAAAIAAG